MASTSDWSTEGYHGGYLEGRRSRDAEMKAWRKEHAEQCLITLKVRDEVVELQQQLDAKKDRAQLAVLRVLHSGLIGSVQRTIDAYEKDPNTLGDHIRELRLHMPLPKDESGA